MTQLTMQEATAMGGKMQNLLKRQHLYYQELKKLSEDQGQFIRNDQSEELLSILGKRQKLVEAISELHKESSIYREKWPDFKELLPVELRNAIGRLLEDLQQMLNAIIEQDKQDCQKLSESKTQVATELQQVQRSKSAAGAYSTSPARNLYSQPGGSGIQFTG
jgi:hypothetical protein